MPRRDTATDATDTAPPRPRPTPPRAPERRRAPLTWIKRSYEERYSTLPAKGEGGYRPKPPAARDAPVAKPSKLHDDGRARVEPRGHKRDRDEQAPSKASKQAALDAGAAPPPSKKQLRKKAAREKKKQASGAPELTADRMAAYAKLKGKKAKKGTE